MNDHRETPAPRPNADDLPAWERARAARAAYHDAAYVEMQARAQRSNDRRARTAQRAKDRAAITPN